MVGAGGVVGLLVVFITGLTNDSISFSSNITGCGLGIGFCVGLGLGLWVGLGCGLG